MMNSEPLQTVAVLAADLQLRQRLETLVTALPHLSLAGAVADLAALSALARGPHIDLVLADRPLPGLGGDGVPAIVLFDAGHPDQALDALQTGAVAALPRNSGEAEIRAALDAALLGLGTVPADLLRLLLAPAAAAPVGRGGDRPELTQRELDVLAALADGASNKVIARRLGISFHTVKFHVAAILAKLDADTRTEAVAQAARRGLVML